MSSVPPALHSVPRRARSPWNFTDVLRDREHSHHASPWLITKYEACLFATAKETRSPLTAPVSPFSSFSVSSLPTSMFTSIRSLVKSLRPSGGERSSPKCPDDAPVDRHVAHVQRQVQLRPSTALSPFRAKAPRASSDRECRCTRRCARPNRAERAVPAAAITTAAAKVLSRLKWVTRGKREEGVEGEREDKESVGEENRRLPVTHHLSGVHRSSMFLLRQTTSTDPFLPGSLLVSHSLAALPLQFYLYRDNEATITFTRVLRGEFALISSYRSFGVRSFDPR